MGETKQINIKNRTYYFYDDIIDIKKFDARLLKLDNKSYKNIGIDDYENIYSVNPLYLFITNANGYIEDSSIDHASGYIKEEVVNKYLVYRCLQMKIKSYRKYNDVWNGIKNKIKEVDNSEFDYGKDYMKIRFNSDDNLPLNKPLKFRNMTITIRFVFEEDGKLCLQFFFRRCFV